MSFERGRIRRRHKIQSLSFQKALFHVMTSSCSWHLCECGGERHPPLCLPLLLKVYFCPIFIFFAIVKMDGILGLLEFVGGCFCHLGFWVSLSTFRSCWEALLMIYIVSAWVSSLTWNSTYPAFYSNIIIFFFSFSTLFFFFFHILPCLNLNSRGEREKKKKGCVWFGFSTKLESIREKFGIIKIWFKFSLFIWVTQVNSILIIRIRYELKIRNFIN